MNECLKEISIYGKPMQMNGISNRECTAHMHAHTQSAVTETHFRCCVSLSFPSSSLVACITFAYGLSARYTRATHTCLYRIRAFRTFVLSTTDAHKQYPQHIQSCYIACHMRPKSIWGFIYVSACVWCLMCIRFSKMHCLFCVNAWLEIRNR